MLTVDKKSKVNIKEATGLDIEQICEMSLGNITRSLEGRKRKSFHIAKVRPNGPQPRGNILLNRNLVSDGRKLNVEFPKIKFHKL